MTVASIIIIISLINCFIDLIFLLLTLFLMISLIVKINSRIYDVVTFNVVFRLGLVIFILTVLLLTLLFGITLTLTWIFTRSNLPSRLTTIGFCCYFQNFWPLFYNFPFVIFYIASLIIHFLSITLWNVLISFLSHHKFVLSEVLFTFESKQDLFKLKSIYFEFLTNIT